MSVPAFVAAVQARDPAAARAALSPAFRGTANGRPMDADAQVRLLESFWAGFPEAPLRMEATGGSGRHVLTWSLSGTHGGVYLGVPPTGAPVSFSGFIVAVSDATGITSLDWKWDTKAFSRAVLGPDQVGDLEVKDTFRDPSKRWQQGAPGGPRRKKGKGRGPPGPRGTKPAEPEGRPPASEGGAAGGATGPSGQPGEPGTGKRRRRRGKGPRADQAPGAAPAVAAGPPAATAADEAATPAATPPAAPDEGAARQPEGS